MANFKVVVPGVLLLVLQDSKAQTLNNFKTEVEQYAQWLNLPTLAVGVAKGDSLIFFCGIGSASTEVQVSITPHHIFGIASLTKSFTWVVMQQLEAEGKFSLTDPVNKFSNKILYKGSLD